MHRWTRRTARTGAGAAAAALTAAAMLTGAYGAQASSPAWRIAQSANVTLSGGRLESIACSSPDACTAVGTDLNTSGIHVTLAERWDGTSWQQQRTPNPAEDVNSSVSPDLLGVSCPARNFCEAVGTYQLGTSGVSLAYGWNGRRWTAQPFPVPVGTDSAQLDAVSCTSPTFCAAVGSYQGTSATLTLAATWNGSAWRLRHSPSPAGALLEQLNAVSCTSRAFCEAWGSGNAGAPGPAVAQRWNGTSWRMQAVPSSAANVSVTSVSCVSASFCEAFGLGIGSGSDNAFAWNGSRWSAQTIPTPASGTLTGVSCASSKSCEAVGPGPAAAEWNGSAWSLQSPPSPPTAAGASMSAVACASAISCQAVGSFEVSQTSSDPKALAEAWNGHAWQLRHAVEPQGATCNSLASVSCSSPSFCEAVGTHFDSAGNQVALTNMWNGTSWKVQPGPANGGGLLSVSCVSASFCEAVGGGTAEMWNGTSWKVQSIPTSAVQPTSVSCATASFCLTADGFGHVAISNGKSWLAGPSVTGLSQVSSVSCVSATFCEAVGSGPSGDNAAAWNGTSWTAQLTPGPVSSFLTAVSCPTASSCEAVGSYANTAFQEATFAEVWNGTAWATQAIPNPATSHGSSLNGVFCTTASSCTAVGDYQSSFLTIFHTLAEVWNGTAWSLRPTPNHSYAGQNRLNGVSCGASGTCTAVGQTEDIGQVEATLVETGD